MKTIKAQGTLGGNTHVSYRCYIFDDDSSGINAKDVVEAVKLPEEDFNSPAEYIQPGLSVYTIKEVAEATERHIKRVGTKLNTNTLIFIFSMFFPHSLGLMHDAQPHQIMAFNELFMNYILNIVPNAIRHFVEHTLEDVINVICGMEEPADRD